MSFWRQVTRGLRGLLHRDECDREIEDEVHHYFEEARAAYRERGLSDEEARRAARLECGDTQAAKEQVRAYGWENMVRLFFGDLRFAGRQLAKSPGYTAAALVTLTLAIGANTAVFGLLYALLLRSLPVQQPDRIVRFQVQITGSNGKGGQPSDMVGDEVYDTLAGKQSVFSGMCAWSEGDLNLQDVQGARPVGVASVTGDCFQTLGVHPRLGRLLIDADDQPGGGPGGFPVVLGYNYWRSRLGSDPDVIGRVMHFGASFRAKAATGVVVGVMEPEFDSVQVGNRPSIYVPLEMTDPKSGRNWGSFNDTVLGRMRDGVTPLRAQAQADGLFNAQLSTMKGIPYLVFDQGGISKAVQAHLIVKPGRTGYSYLRNEYAKPLYLIEGMVGLSLLVACAYLALLSSARALARRRELAVRTALGASRWRVASALWLESALLALAGGCLGVLSAWGAEHGLVALMKDGGNAEPPALHAGPGYVVLLFSLGLTAITVLVSGVLPAWRGSLVDPVNDIKEGENVHRDRRRMGLSECLVPLEIGVSLTIVVIAALMGSTVARLVAVDPGFRTSGVTFFGADFSSRTQHSEKGIVPVPLALFSAALDRIRHTPGVESASISQAYPLMGASYLQSASSTLPSGGERKDAAMTSLAVTSGYFETLGVPLLAGRDFTENDIGDTLQACILSRAAAQYFFPGGSAVGGTLALNKDTRIRVVGVVGDTLYSDLRDKAPRILYLPYLGGVFWNPFAKVEVRSHDSAVAVTAVRNAFHDVAPDVALDTPITMTELIEGSMGRERMVALLSEFFAVLTLLLSAVGMYGLLNYSVARRRKEIGVRMALGATRGGVVRLFARKAFWMIVPGLALGGIGAWAATWFLRSLLFEVKPMDPWVMAASAAALIGTAFVACLLPARRAAGVQPVEALRCE